MMVQVLPYVLAYFIGSIPFGLILTKLFTKQNLREIGSGNIGATNVLRTGNKKLAFLTLLLDLLKAALAIGIGTLLISAFTSTPPVGLCQDIETEELIPCGPAPAVAGHASSLAIGFLAILGHCFPVWLKFKGGKGVATALGALLAAAPLAGLAACGLWLASAFAFKISSLAALIAIGLAPVVTFFIYGPAPAGVCVLIALLVFWRHKDNIKRLIKREEPKIGAKK